MSSLLLVGNPRRRRRAAAKSAPRRTRARRNTAKRRTAKRHSAPVAVAANPVRRRRRTRARHNSVHRRARRNPIHSGGLRGVTTMLKSAAVMAGGAVGVDVAFGFVKDYLPASIATPVDTANGGPNYGYYAVKGAFAIGAGMLMRRFLHGNATRVAEGSLVVTMHDLAKQIIAANASTVPMGRFIPTQINRIAMNPGRTVPGRMARAGNVVGLGRFIQAGAAARRGV